MGRTSGGFASASAAPTRPTREIVSAYVLSRFAEPDDEVRELIERAADETERLVEEIAAEDADPLGEVID